MLTPEQAKALIDMGIPVVPDASALHKHGVVLPIVHGFKHMRLVKFTPDDSLPRLVMLYTETEVSVEDATEQAIDHVTTLGSDSLLPQNAQPVLVI